MYLPTRIIYLHTNTHTCTIHSIYSFNWQNIIDKWELNLFLILFHRFFFLFYHYRLFVHACTSWMVDVFHFLYYINFFITLVCSTAVGSVLFANNIKSKVTVCFDRKRLYEIKKFYILGPILIQFTRKSTTRTNNSKEVSLIIG